MSDSFPDSAAYVTGSFFQSTLRMCRQCRLLLGCFCQPQDSIQDFDPMTIEKVDPRDISQFAAGSAFRAPGAQCVARETARSACEG